MERVFGDDEDGGVLVGCDPYDCEACLAIGDDCPFHAGFAAGWDACGAFVARAVDEDRSCELVSDVAEAGGGWLW